MKHKWKLRRRGSWEHHLKLLGSEHQNKLKLIILFERTILVKNLTHQLSSSVIKIYREMQLSSSVQEYILHIFKNMENQ